MNHKKNLKLYLKKAPEGGAYKFFTTKNGVNIRIGIWNNAQNNPKSTVILLPGATEFIEKYYEVIRELLERSYGVAIMDWRGQGLSDRLLENKHKHHIDSFETYLSDLEGFIGEVDKENLTKPFNILAHSMGGHLALRYIHDNPDVISRVVLSAPMVAIRYGFIPEFLAKGLISRALKKGRAEDYSPGQSDYGPRKRGKSAMRILTHDPIRFMGQHVAIDDNQDLALGGQTYGWVGEAIKSINILNSPGYAEIIKTPTLIVQAGKDLLVKNKTQKAFSERLPNGTFKVLPNAAHEILNEVDEVRGIFWHYFDEFMG